MELLILLIIYIIFSFVAGAVGTERTIGFWHALFISFLLSPIVGLILAFNSERYVQKEFREIQLEYFKRLNPESDINRSSTNHLENKWQYPDY